MGDLISRQSAIDAIENVSCSDGNGISVLKCEAIDDVVRTIRNLPSAQPEERTNKRTETHACDLIDRRMAIDALIERDANCGIDSAKVIKALPPAQPEHETGTWIERNPQNSDKCRLIECSECGNAYIVGYNIDYDEWIDGRNFCMKCGADLRGGSNGKST